MRFSVLAAGVLALVSFSLDRAAAQQVAIGVLGGIRATDDSSGSLTSESKRYIVGPMVDVRLPLSLSFEFDALYRRFGFTGYAGSPFFSSITRERANSWEFPLILKYRFPGLRVRPFVGVGYAPRVVHGTDVSSGSFLSVPTGMTTYYFNRRLDTSYPVTNGIVVSGGVELRAGRVGVSPQVRYVHWAAPFLNSVGGDGSFQFSSQQDDFFVMLGVSWH